MIASVRDQGKSFAVMEKGTSSVPCHCPSKPVALYRRISKLDLLLILKQSSLVNVER